MKKNTYLAMCDAVIANQAKARAEQMRTVLCVVSESGPRSRNILEGLCGGLEPGLLDTMVACGMVAPIGERRGTVYGTPEQARAGKRKAA